MKLNLKPETIGSICIEIGSGILTLMVGAILILTTGILVEAAAMLYEAFGKWLLLTPVALAGTWALGHVVFNHRYWDKDNVYNCGGCNNFQYTNLFTEWWHKRKCLPLIVKDV